MDEWNIRNIHRIIGNDPEGKVFKLLEFAGDDSDIADPWYTGNFDETYRDVLKGCQALIKKLKVRLESEEKSIPLNYIQEK